MAKVKGPFLSMKASGKVGDTLVASNWKGIKIMRAYVVPANPNTAAQQKQRGYVRIAIAKWHGYPWTDADLTAWIKLASLSPYGQTGPNQFTRESIRIQTIPSAQSPLTDGRDNASAGVDRTIKVLGAAGLATVRFRWGYKPRVLKNDNATGGHDGIYWYYQIPAGTITSGTRVFWQAYDGATPEASIGITGIYSFVMP